MQRAQRLEVSTVRKMISDRNREEAMRPVVVEREPLVFSEEDFLMTGAYLFMAGVIVALLIVWAAQGSM